MEMDVLHIYTDASYYRVGTIIMHTGKLLLEASSRKLKDQKNYPTVVEKEMLSVILCLKTFHTIIIGNNKTDAAIIQMLGVTMDRLLHVRLSDPPENLPPAPSIEPEPPPPIIDAFDDSLFNLFVKFAFDDFL